MATYPVSLPGKFHGYRSLGGGQSMGLKESNMPEHSCFSHFYLFLLPCFMDLVELSIFQYSILSTPITFEILIPICLPYISMGLKHTSLTYHNYFKLVIISLYV